MPGLFGTKFHKSEDSVSLQLNGWTKIGLCALASIITLFIKDVSALGVLLTGSAILAISQLKFKVIFFLYLIIAFMCLFSMGWAYLIAQAINSVSPMMGKYDLSTMMAPFMRMIIVMQVIVVTALSTSPQEILINLKSVKLPRFLYLPVLIMLRFVPTFINDLKQVNESLKIRGMKISIVSMFTHPILTMRCSVFPLIFRAFRSSDDLAIASELKGVGHYHNVTSFKTNSFKRVDIGMIGLTSLFVAGSVYLHCIAPEALGIRERMMKENELNKGTKSEMQSQSPSVKSPRLAKGDEK